MELLTAKDNIIAHLLSIAERYSSSVYLATVALGTVADLCDRRPSGASCSCFCFRAHLTAWQQWERRPSLPTASPNSRPSWRLSPARTWQTRRWSALPGVLWQRSTTKVPAPFGSFAALNCIYLTAAAAIAQPRVSEALAASVHHFLSLPVSQAEDARHERADVLRHTARALRVLRPNGAGLRAPRLSGRLPDVAMQRPSWNEAPHAHLWRLSCKPCQRLTRCMPICFTDSPRPVGQTRAPRPRPR